MDLVFLSLQGLMVSRYPGEDAFLGSHEVGDCTQLRFSSCEGFFLLPPHPQVILPVSRKRFARSSATFVHQNIERFHDGLPLAFNSEFALREGLLKHSRF